MKNANHKWIAGPLIVGLTTVGIAGVLFAQPDAGDMGKGENPQADGRGGRGGNRPDFRNMTAAQREEMKTKFDAMRKERRAEGLRNTLAEAGFTDKAVQDAVIAFANGQDEERDDSREKVQALSQALRNDASDKEVAVLLTDLREETKSAQAKRQAALRALDGKIGYSKKPRLDAILTLAGVTGEHIGGRGGRGGHGGFGGPGGRGGDRPDGVRPGDLD